MTYSRAIKVRKYFSLRGTGELIKDAKYLLRRSYLGLPRIEITDLIKSDNNQFEISIPIQKHDQRNASLTLNDKLAIASICQLIKPNSVIEIGTFHGETTDLIARNCLESKIYTLDLPPDFTSHSQKIIPDDLEVLKLRQPGHHIQEHYETGSQVYQIYGDSATFDFKQLETKFDLAFIDGAHSYEYVKNDTEKILPLMNKKGWIIWDDYCFSFPEIIRYLNSLRPNKAFHIYGTRLAIIQLD